MADVRFSGGEDSRFDFRLGYFINDQLEVEAQYTVRTPESIFDDNFQNALMINGIYHFQTEHRGKPYLLLGVGTVEMSGPGGIAGFGSNDDSVGYQMGLGVRYYPSSERFSLRAELSALSEDTFGERSTHLSLSGGVAWRFGV